jgi:hypothetical protein
MHLPTKVAAVVAQLRHHVCILITLRYGAAVLQRCLNVGADISSPQR